MTPNPISNRLHSCQGLTNALRTHLEAALLLAHEQNYPQEWIDAIQKALNQNEQAWAHIHNTAILIQLVPTPLPFSNIQAINRRPA